MTIADVCAVGFHATLICAGVVIMLFTSFGFLHGVASSWMYGRYGEMFSSAVAGGVSLFGFGYLLSCWAMWVVRLYF